MGKCPIHEPHERKKSRDNQKQKVGLTCKCPTFCTSQRFCQKHLTDACSWALRIMPHSVLEKNDCSPEESFWYYPLAQPELPKMSPLWCQCSRYLRWAWLRTVRCFGGVLLSLWVTLSCPASLQSWFLGCSPLGSPLLSLLLRFPAPHFCLPKGAQAGCRWELTLGAPRGGEVLGELPGARPGGSHLFLSFTPLELGS